jgi:hypothetical protein
MGSFVAGWVVWSALTWTRYGHIDLSRKPRDELLDRFIPDPEVDEYHHITVHAPVPIVFEVARHADIQSAPFVKQVFWLRELPGLLRGRPVQRISRGLIDEVLANGYGVLAELPERKIVIGTYTQPWHGEVVFKPLPPGQFAAFHEPGFVKIAVVLGAEPLNGGATRFYTRTRVVTTDAESRRKFRLYWGPFSAGIILIRYTVLPMVRREAERRARSSSPNSRLATTTRLADIGPVG